MSLRPATTHSPLRAPARASAEAKARSPSPPSPMARSLALAFGAFGGLMVAASPVPVRAQALPQGGVVVDGSATFQQVGNKLTVTNTPGAAINWQSFNIGAGATTHFQQQSAASSVLNRVIGPDPSQIYGALTSNGRVVLVNPAGIVFGAGAAVDTAGFVASTVNISDADWRAGRLRFAEPSAAGTIQLHGANGQTPAASIRAQGGDIVLIAPQVDIASGAVARATGGDVIVAAGRSVELTGRGYEGIRLLVQAPGDKATNLGKLEGDAVAIFARSLKNFGTVQATGATVRDGRVMLVAQDSAEVGGQITANRTADGSNPGGNVTVLASTVSLQGANIDASGTNAGGQVNIGGNWQGRGDPLPDAPQALAAVGGAANAQNTQVDAATTINASATQTGNGGQVVVWADGRTDFAGQVQAKGGSQGGDGGNVEVSGKQVLKFADTGFVDTRAPNGRTGNLLLDPTNITIATVGGDVTPAAIQTALATTDVTITTNGAWSPSLGSGGSGADGDITVLNPISAFGVASNRKLRLEAYRHIDFAANADILFSNGSLAAGVVELEAGTSGVGTINTASASLTASKVQLKARSDMHLGLINVSGGFGVGQVGGEVSLVSVGGGIITLNHAVTANGSNGGFSNTAGSAGGLITISSGGNLLLNHAGAGQLRASGGSASLGSNGNGGRGGDIRITATGALTVNDARFYVDGGQAQYTTLATVGTSGAGGTIVVGSGGALTLGGTILNAQGGSGLDALVGTSDKGAHGGAGGQITLTSGTNSALALSGYTTGGPPPPSAAALQITARGGEGGSGGDSAPGGASGNGGTGGVVSIVAGGNLTLEDVQAGAGGGDGGSNSFAASLSGGGGNAGLVLLRANGPTGNITFGGNLSDIGAGFGYGGAGQEVSGRGTGGEVRLQALNGNIAMSPGATATFGALSINATAKNDLDFSGATLLSSPPDLPANGGSVNLTSSQGGTITIDKLLADGGGQGDINEATTLGGAGGNVVIQSLVGNLNLVGVGAAAISAAGGQATGEGGRGGGAGSIAVSSTGNLSLSGNLVFTAKGADGRSSSIGGVAGGRGGNGGSVGLTAVGQLLTAGGMAMSVNASGGDGGLNTSGTSVATHGRGGGGGAIDIIGEAGVTLGAAGFNLGLTADGGFAGESVDFWGNGGRGGDGGRVAVNTGSGSGNVQMLGTSMLSALARPGGYGGIDVNNVTFAPGANGVAVTGSKVEVYANSGAVSLSAATTLQGPTVTVQAGTNVNVGTVVATDGAGNGGEIVLRSMGGGTINVAGVLVALGQSGGDVLGSARGVNGGHGGKVTLISAAGNLTVVAPPSGIAVTGGNGYTDTLSTGGGGHGGNGGEVTIASGGTGQLVTTGLTVYADGGEGAAAPSTVAAVGGNGGMGGRVVLQSVAAMAANGLFVTANGGASGVGGDPDPLTGAGAVSGTAGNGGRFTVSSGGSLQISGFVSAYGGLGANVGGGGYFEGGVGGNGGTVDIATNLGPITVSGSLYAGVSGGQGGSGGLSSAFPASPSPAPPMPDVAYAGGAGGGGGFVSIRSNGGGNLTVNGPLTVGANGGEGGAAGLAPSPAYAPAVGGAGGNAGGVQLGSGHTNAVVLNGLVSVGIDPGFEGADSAGGAPGNSGVYSALQLESGAGGISSGSSIVSGGAGVNLIVNSAGGVSLPGANAFYQVSGVTHGATTIRNDASYNMWVSMLTVNGGNATFSGQSVGLDNVFAPGGSLSATGGSINVHGGVSAAGGVNLTATNGSIQINPLNSFITGGNVHLSATGGGSNSVVYVYRPVTSTVGDVVINATGLVRAQTGGSINSARDVLISGGPGTAAADPDFPNAAVALGSGVGSSGGGATQVVAARNVSISTGGGDLVVQAEQSPIPNYSVKLVSAADMTLDLGGGALHIKGGQSAGSFALVDPTTSGTLNINNASAINITGGGTAGAYAGLASVGDINNLSSAPVTVNPGVAGALVVATNVATLPGLTIPGGSQASGPMVVDPNTGAVTVGGVPWAGGGFIAGLPGAAFPPVAPAPSPTPILTTSQVQFIIITSLLATQNSPNSSGGSGDKPKGKDDVVIGNANCSPGGGS